MKIENKFNKKLFSLKFKQILSYSSASRAYLRDLSFISPLNNILFIYLFSLVIHLAPS